MGIEGLTTLLRAAIKEFPPELEIVYDTTIDQITDSTLVLDFSLMAFQYGAGLRGELSLMHSGCLAGFFSLLRTLRKGGNKIIVVFDQESSKTNVYADGSALLERLTAEMNAPTRSDGKSPFTPSSSSSESRSSSLPIETAEAQAQSQAQAAGATSSIAVSPMGGVRLTTDDGRSPPPLEPQTQAKPAFEPPTSPGPQSQAKPEFEPLVSSGPPLSEDLNRLDFAIVMQAKTETRQKRIDDRALREEATGKDQFRVTRPLVEIVEKVCQELGIISLHPLVEADWLIAAVAKVESGKRHTYIITDDTDLLVYDIGDARILRRFTLTEEPKKKGAAYQVIEQRRMWEELFLTDMRRRAYIASMLGCDYFDGIKRIGPKTVMHILQIDPRYCRSLRLTSPYFSEVIKATKKIPPRERGMDPMSDPYSAITLKAFNKYHLSPSVLLDHTNDELDLMLRGNYPPCKSPTHSGDSTGAWARFPCLVGKKSLDHYIRHCHTPRISEDTWERFITSVSIIMIGPALEEKNLSEKACTPSEEPLSGGGDTREALVQLIDSVVGIHRKRVYSSLHSLGLHLISQEEVEETREMMSELGLQPMNEPSSP